MNNPCYVVSVLLISVLASCSSTMPIYNVFPSGRVTAEGDDGILLVSSKLQVLSIDGKEARPKGKEGTAYRLPPGQYRLKAKVDYIDAVDLDLMGRKYFSSGEMDITATIKRDHIHNLQVLFARDRAWLELVSGKNPLTLKDGTVISFSLENRKIEVRTGDQVKKFDLLTNSMSFSPDGTRVSFLNFDRGFWVAYFSVVVDGKEGGQIGNLVRSYWSPDSRHFAYVATGLMMNRPYYVFVDSQDRISYDDILNASSFFFSADGKFCYAAEKDGAWYLVRGDREQKMTSQEEASAALEAARNTDRK